MAASSSRRRQIPTPRRSAPIEKDWRTSAQTGRSARHDCGTKGCTRVVAPILGLAAVEARTICRRGERSTSSSSAAIWARRCHDFPVDLHFAGETVTCPLLVKIARTEFRVCGEISPAVWGGDRGGRGWFIRMAISAAGEQTPPATMRFANRNGTDCASASFTSGWRVRHFVLPTARCAIRMPV